MILAVAAFFAGVFSVLAPCVLPLLPLLVARSSDESSRHRPYLVIIGLALSVIFFSVLLKSSTLLIAVPTYVWSIVSGTIVALFGITLCAPRVWDDIVLKFGAALASQRLMSRSSKRPATLLGDMLLGASLGPIFSVCSPTYALIVASILPASPVEGMLYLIAYVVGIVVMLSVALMGGRSLVRRLGWSLNPHGLFRRIVGVTLVIIGVSIVIGLDKVALDVLVASGVYDWQVTIEGWLAQ